ncbi:MAG: exodeoxyribonuclease V subunit gamma [Opitutales bacterium]
MSRLQIEESASQEHLADKLIARLSKTGSSDLFAAQSVVVQNAGLGRWLRLRQAELRGISAGVSLPFVRSFVGERLAEAGRYDPDAQGETEGLQWRIFDHLVERTFTRWGAAGEPLVRYLDSSHPRLEARCWNLAAQVARLVDQYAIYRPVWLESWLAGKFETAEDASHAAWQGRLIQALADEGVAPANAWGHRLLGLALHRFLRDGDAFAPFKEPVFVFGIGGFPPAFLAFFQRLAEAGPVELFHLLSSEAYLGDLPRKVRQIAGVAEEAEEASPKAVFFDNSLLVRNGQAAARFQGLLLACGFDAGDLPDPTEHAPGSDLERLRHAVRFNEAASPFHGDGSISIHATHSSVREVQVLQQQLLALLSREPRLRPDDILVLCPDITAYANDIEAVFGAGTRLENGESRQLPFAIADRIDPRVEGAWRFLETFLNLLKGRQAFNDVAALLDFPPMETRLGASREEIDEVLALLQNEAGVRWGIDAAARRAQGLPDFPEYSWAYGLFRLFDGIVCGEFDDGEGAPLVPSTRQAEILGALVSLLRGIFALARSAAESRSFAQWLGAVLPVLESALSPDSEGSEWYRSLAQVLGETCGQASNTAVSLATFSRMVLSLKPEPRGPAGLLRGGITFCRMQPGRHIPKPVICLLGLNDLAFPRQGPALEFDLMGLSGFGAASGEEREIQFLGDPRRREDDRQLFLDCMLNARRYLIITCIGFNQQTNDRVPPSVVVAELRQYLESQAVPGAPSPWVEHPLQEWSPANFTHPQPHAGQMPVPLHFDTRLARPRENLRPRPPFFLFDGERSEEAESPREVSPRELANFFKDPADYFLQRVLRVKLDLLKPPSAADDTEALRPDGLQSWQLRARVLKAWLQRPASFDAAGLRQRLANELGLPPGLSGKRFWQEKLEPVVELLRAYLGTSAPTKAPVRRQFDRVWLVDETLTLEDGRSVQFALSKSNPHRVVEMMARHVATGKPAILLQLADAQAWQVPEAAPTGGESAWLTRAVAAWQRGQFQPLALSPKIGWELVKRLQQKEPPENPLAEAFTAGWEPYKPPGDKTPAQLTVFANESPASPGSEFAAEFEANVTSLLADVYAWHESLVPMEPPTP